MDPRAERLQQNVEFGAMAALAGYVFYRLTQRELRRLEWELRNERWFLDPSWQLGEQEATRDLQEGRTTRHEDDESFLAALSPPAVAAPVGLAR